MKKLLTFLVTLVYLFFPSLALAGSATLSLSPSTGTFNKGCPFTLDVNLNTGGSQTDGTDAILFYDISRFSATSITSGTIYPDFPGNNIDDQNGKVTISGLASVTSAFSGQGILAKVNFTVKDSAPAGASQIKFDFDPNDKAKTTDSNVVERGTVTDVLNSVVNGNYTVGTGSCTSQTQTGAAGGGAVAPQGATSVATPTAQPVVVPLKNLDQAVGGKTGSVELTYTLGIIGVAMTILGILGLVLL